MFGSSNSTVVAASNESLILTIDNEHEVVKANKRLSELENALEKELNKKYKLIFIGPDRWQNEKKKYVENLKNKYVYEYIKEEYNDFDKSKLNDVFNLDKIEIV